MRELAGVTPQIERNAWPGCARPGPVMKSTSALLLLPPGLTSQIPNGEEPCCEVCKAPDLCADCCEPPKHQCLVGRVGQCPQRGKLWKVLGPEKHSRLENFCDIPDKIFWKFVDDLTLNEVPEFPEPEPASGPYHRVPNAMLPDVSSALLHFVVFVTVLMWHA